MLRGERVSLQGSKGEADAELKYPSICMLAVGGYYIWYHFLFFIFSSSCFVTLEKFCAVLSIFAVLSSMSLSFSPRSSSICGTGVWSAAKCQFFCLYFDVRPEDFWLFASPFWSDLVTMAIENYFFWGWLQASMTTGITKSSVTRP